MIFSATLASGFHGVGAPGHWLAGHLLTNGVFATCLDKLLREDDPLWRLGYYLAPAIWARLLWQVFALTGIYAAGLIPKTWSPEFMATIALITLLVPMAKVRPMLIVALAAIVVSDVLVVGGTLEVFNPKLAAANVAVAAAALSRKPWLPFVGGMAALLGIRYLGG